MGNNIFICRLDFLNVSFKYGNLIYSKNLFKINYLFCKGIFELYWYLLVNVVFILISCI